MEVNKNYKEFNSKKTYDIVGNLIKQVESEKKLKAIYGRIEGSKAQGIFSKSSDNDFAIFCTRNKDNNEEVVLGSVYKEGEVNGERVEFEIVYIYMDAVLKDAKELFHKEFKGYPTNFYRTEEENNSFLPQNLPESRRQRKEYAFYAFHLSLLADTIWVSEDYFQYDFYEYYKLEKTIDMLDNLFVRVYGNYEHYFKDKSQVLVRKYLYTLSNICAVEWLLTKRTRPPMDFFELIEGQVKDIEVRQHIDRMVELNRSTKICKTKYYEDADVVLNNYINSKLLYAREKIEKYSRTETYADIIKNTEPNRRPKIYDEKYHDWRKV